MLTVSFVVEIARGTVLIQVYLVDKTGHVNMLLVKCHSQDDLYEIAYSTSRARALFDGICKSLSDATIRFIKWEEIPEIMKETCNG